MRLLPLQVARTVKIVTPGSGTIDVSKLKQVPGVQYRALIVGGAGGWSARAIGYTSSVYSGKAGGGGGGMLMIKGYVRDLPDLVPYTVGAAGTSPANAAANAKAPNGGKGGDSLFHSAEFTAYGGQGGIGGDYSGNATSGSGGSAYGGAGGWNSKNIGDNGGGAYEGFVQWDPSGSPNGGAAMPPSDGAIEYFPGFPLTSTPMLLAGGGGGGGGRPSNNWIGSSPTDGGAGSTNQGIWVNGSPPVSRDGGCGGGTAYQQLFADPENGTVPVDSSPLEFYGSGGTKTGELRFATGLVAVRFF